MNFHGLSLSRGFCGSSGSWEPRAGAMSGAPGHPSGGTIHPSVLQTPPQAGVEIVRHTTPENIRKFFDPATYRKPRDMVSTCDPCSSPTNCQKRSPPSEASSAVAKAPKTLGKDELLEKFKLAATLNGIDWGDLAVSRLCKSLYMFF